MKEHRSFLCFRHIYSESVDKIIQYGEIGLIVDEVCEVVTLVVDEIDKPNIDASSTGKELFINGIGKNGDELISLFEIGSIVSDKDAN